MGTHHDDGYSADVRGFFVVGRDRIRLAKTNGCTFVLAELWQLLAGTEGQLIVIVDGIETSRPVRVLEDVNAGETTVKYSEIVPVKYDDEVPF